MDYVHVPAQHKKGNRYCKYVLVKKKKIEKWKNGKQNW